MRGVGEATAAISVVNALPTGIGAAAGIALRTRVEVELEAGGQRSTPLRVTPESSGTPLVRAAVAEGVRRFLPEDLTPVRVEVSSEIPPATGLKSSSAVTSAVLLAVANAVSRRPTAEEIARITAELGRETGVSATGAFDDALAGLSGDLILTDNSEDALLARFPIDRGLSVALWIPPGTHPAAPGSRLRFRSSPAESHAPVAAARAGRLWDAMELNSGLVEEAMDYPYRDLRRAMREAGAVASGVSGLGPSFAAVAPRGRIPSLLDLLGRRPGTVRSVDFVPSYSQELFR
ncbi:MAG TPA: shikimate kinase [Thermoplasmata archaeon]|nr:shikimate kinase [Thermoplasmata archaeon]